VFLDAFYNPDLTPSNFDLFDTLKDRLQKKITFTLRVQRLSPVTVHGEQLYWAGIHAVV